MSSVGEAGMRPPGHQLSRSVGEVCLGKSRFCYMVEDKFQDLVEVYISSIYKEKTRQLNISSLSFKPNQTQKVRESPVPDKKHKEL